jgi:hypothetical protein
MLGKYPVGRDDAANLAALQLLAEFGLVPNPETCMQTLAFGELIDSWIGEGVSGDQSHWSTTSCSLTSLSLYTS